MKNRGESMLAPKTNCRGCTKRYPGCHSKCEDYIKARAEYDEWREAERKDAAARADQFRRILEAEKRTRRWKK